MENPNKEKLNNVTDIAIDILKQQAEYIKRKSDLSGPIKDTDKDIMAFTALFTAISDILS